MRVAAAIMEFRAARMVLRAVVAGEKWSPAALGRTALLGSAAKAALMSVRLTVAVATWMAMRTAPILMRIPA